jgi:hypothetical protein
MADSYYSDPAYSKPSLLERFGSALARIGRVLDGWVSIAVIPIQATGSAASSMWGWIASSVASLWGGGAATAPATFGEFFKSWGITTGTFGAGIFAAVVAAGSVMKAGSAILEGNWRKATTFGVRGAAEAGATMLSGLTLGLGEIVSLVATGKFLSTNAGDYAERTVKEWIGTGAPAQVNTTPNVNQTLAALGPAPTLQPQMGMVTAMPQAPIYYMPVPQQTMMMPAGMVPQMAVPAAAVAPVPQGMVMMAPPVAPQAPVAPVGQWTNMVAAQGYAPQVQGQQVRTLSVEPRTAQGFAQAEAARQAAAVTTGPVVG